MKNIFKPDSKASFWYAVATLVGSTVGVGIFGIPFVFVKAGFLPAIVTLVVLTIIVVFLNLMYGEIVLRSESHHQIIGYTEKYLGLSAKRVIVFASVLSVYGALLSYIIISGTFLATFLSGIIFLSPASFSLLFFIVGSIVLFFGLKLVSRFDLAMLVLFVVVVGIFGILGIRSINLSNFVLTTGQFQFLPFCVILFALSGMASIPLVRERVSGEEYEFKKAIIWGTVIPAVLYLIFTLAVVTISGEITSPDAISGLFSFVGQKVVILGALFGFCAVSTSFLGLGVALSESFQYDFKLSRLKSWLLVVIPPLVLFLAGLRNFIEVIGLVGGVALSIEGIFMLFIYAKARKSGDRLPEYSVGIPKPILYVIGLVFILGLVYTLIS